MLERALIDHGSPTLANMKVGSLFTSSCADADGFRAEFRRVQAALESRGVSLTILRVQQERALVYVYRQEALAALLAQADVQAFLRAMGYGTSPRTAHWRSCGSAFGGIALLPRTKSASSSATP